MSAEQLLKKLLEDHFYRTKDSISWSWQEDLPLSRLDQELSDALLVYMQVNGIE